ncbi:MAG: hypothetical protein H6707_00440 [Deltaproteobacteria bacterium]|nr:hypothetical protein [Deltaproteobacteria bacterium]
MKRSHTCPKCHHGEVLYIREVNDEMESRSARWRLARVKQSERGLLGDRTWINMYGLVEAYVCRACGYTEFYTRDAAEIPVDGVSTTLLSAADKPGPYR